MWNRELQDEVVSALRDGFGHDRVTVRRYRHPRHTIVTVTDLPGEIKVSHMGIEVPPAYPDVIKAGIRLDLQAIMASR